MKLPLFLVKTLIRTGLLKHVDSVQRMLEGHAEYLKYYSDQVLSGPAEELKQLEAVLSGLTGRKLECDMIEETVDSHSKTVLKQIDMSIGSPSYTQLTEGHLSKAMLGYENSVIQYPPFSGHEHLKSLICKRLEKTTSIKYSTEEVLITSGATQGIELVFQSFLNPGDSIVLLDPSFMVYKFCADLHQVKIRWVPSSIREGYIFFDELVLEKQMKKSKMIIINSPSNPSGGVLHLEQLKIIAKLARKHDLLVVSDEVYDQFYFDHKPTSIASLKGAYERTIVINSMSKTYGMAGFRVGYLAAFKPLIRPVSMNLGVRNPFVSNFNQSVASSLLESSQGVDRAYMAELKKKRDLCLKELTKKQLFYSLPLGAFYVWVEVPDIGLSSIEFCKRIFIEKNIRFMPGEYFGPSGKKFIRMSLAGDNDQIIEAVARISSFASSLRSH